MSRRVLVTGASRGIGRAIAAGFAERGDRVAVHYGRSEDAARAVVEALPGDGHVMVQADLQQPDDVRRMVDSAADQLGGLDVLVNNAGVFRAHPPLETSWEDWQAAWTRDAADQPAGSGARDVRGAAAPDRRRRWRGGQRVEPRRVPG